MTDNAILNVTRTPGDPEYNVSLNFVAYACIIENPTAGWWYLPDSYQYIPPFTFGQSVLFPNGVNNAHVLFQAPAGITNTVPTANINTAAFKFFGRRDIQASAGLSGSAPYSRRAVTIDIQTILTLPGGVFTYELNSPASDGLYITLRGITIVADTGIILRISYKLVGDTVERNLRNNRASLSANFQDPTPEYAYNQPLPAGTKIILTISGFPAGGMVAVFRY